MEKLKKLNEINDFPILLISNEKFKEFGKIIENYDFSELINIIDKETEVPENGNIYVASLEKLEKLKIFNSLKDGIYGGIEPQIGYCNGNNSYLNGLEYHKSSEINIAITDFVLLLSHVKNIEKGELDSKNVKAFYVKKGEAIELYQTTMHFAPCKIENLGFKCGVILAKGTNLDINLNIKKIITEEDKYLFKKNKWLLVHEEKKDLIEKGAYKGIKGENIEVRYKK